VPGLDQCGIAVRYDEILSGKVRWLLSASWCRVQTRHNVLSRRSRYVPYAHVGCELGRLFALGARGEAMPLVSGTALLTLRHRP
jgi:hypothetical protein